MASPILHHLTQANPSQPYATRTATGSLTSTRKRTIDDADADPDFLALSRKQRRRVDGAFERALRELRKRRKMTERGKGADDGGDDAMGGGFVADDDAGGGGFMADDDNDDEPTPPAPHPSETADLLPYSALPDVFSSLGLAWDDDVLATFKAIQASSRGTQGADQTSWSMEDNYVDLKDFRSVVGVLMEPEEDQPGDDNYDDESDGSADAYTQDEEMHASSDLSEPDDTASTTKTRRTRRTKQPTAEEDALRIDQPGQRKLTREEKDWVANMWETMFEGTTIGPGQRGENGRLLGKEQIKRWADQLGMTWTDQEVSLD
jgi:hypothetical protein